MCGTRTAAYSNWVVQGRVLVGAYPLKPYMTEAILKQGASGGDDEGVVRKDGRGRHSYTAWCSWLISPHVQV